MDIVATPPQALTPLAPPNGLVARWQGMPVGARMRLGAGLAAVVAVVVALLLWANQEAYQPVYTGLPDKEAGAIVAQLTQQNIPHKVGSGGVILVPADRVHEVRMRMATAGLPKSPIAGNELLDNPRLGQTDRQERLMVQRALEGELTRTITQIDGVQDVRLHLALPNQNGFFREQQKPSASVVLTLQPGIQLDRKQVAGIVHLISSSVPELSPKSVSVLDQSGALLSGNKDEGVDDGSHDEQQLQFINQVEANYLRRVREILEPIVGASNMRATVTADIDFTQSESTSEQYRPNQGAEPAAVRSQQTNESNAGSPPGPSGIPGATSNQPPVPATAPINGASAPLQVAGGGQSGGQQNTRRDVVTNYEVDKTVRVTRHPVGVIKRINAAVVLNHVSKTDAKGKTTTLPLPQEELDKLTSLVQEAIGFSKDRGDSVKVVSSPFQPSAPVEDVATPLWKNPVVLDIARNGGVPAALALVALGLIFGIIKPALQAQRKPEEPATVDAVVDGNDVLPMPSEMPMLEPPREPEKLNQARQIAKDNPAAVANIMRDWVNGAGKEGGG